MFFLRTFGKESRTEQEIDDDEVCFNDIFGLDNYTMANNDFSDPFITCTFITNDQIFVNFFHNYSYTHYHFIWDVKQRRVIGKKPKKNRN